jgi:hypothetical protein
MAFSGMLRRVTLVRTDFLEELRDSFIRVTRIGELGTLADEGSATFVRNVGHPDEGVSKFLRNVGSYKSHTA